MSAIGAVTLLGMLAPTRIQAAEKAPEVDTKIRKELEDVEERFAKAIEKRDTAVLSELLADYYADSVGDQEKAMGKRMVIARAKAGTLALYRIARDVRLRASADTYDLEGEAKAPPPLNTDEPAPDKWVHVRRVWAKKDGRWILIMQNVRELKDEKSEVKEK